jgi:hypothetical protein
MEDDFNVAPRTWCHGLVRLRLKFSLSTEQPRWRCISHVLHFANQVVKTNLPLLLAAGRLSDAVLEASLVAY